MSAVKASMREASGKALVAVGADFPQVVVLEADIGKSTQSIKFRDAYPERYFNIGVAEQNMAGFAAGLATTGLVPICSTYAVFMSMRALEPIRQSICYPRLDVKFAATHGGLATGIDGASHQAIEDIAIFRALPEMRVLVPADAASVEPAYRAALAHDGPVYIRLTRDAVPVLYDTPPALAFGKARLLAAGDDVTLWACGLMVSLALEARQLLAAEGVSARVVDSASVKPLDEALLVRCALETGAVVTCEDGVVNGGLGSAVAEALGERCPVPMERVGLRDTFGESGKPELLFDKYGMSPRHIAEAAKRVIRRGDARGVGYEA